MVDQQSDQTTQRARYSTRWPADGWRLAESGQRLSGDAAPQSDSAFRLSVNQWTALICLGVVLFVGLALATGLVVGRTLRGPFTGEVSTAMRRWDTTPRSAVIAEAQTLVTYPEERVNPRTESGVSEKGLSLLFDDVLAVGDEAPDFQLEAIDGGRLSLSDLKGRSVLVNFWATWCNWCKYELPALQAVYEKYRNEGLIVVGVDVEEPRPLVKAYVERYGLTFPVVLDIEAATARTYRVRGLPMTYFVSPEGTITRVQRGAMREDELELYVHKVLTTAD